TAFFLHVHSFIMKYYTFLFILKACMSAFSIRFVKYSAFYVNLNQLEAVLDEKYDYHYHFTIRRHYWCFPILFCKFRRRKKRNTPSTYFPSERDISGCHVPKRCNDR